MQDYHMPFEREAKNDFEIKLATILVFRHFKNMVFKKWSKQHSGSNAPTLLVPTRMPLFK